MWTGTLYTMSKQRGLTSVRSSVPSVVASVRQGLTLVHSSAQLERCLTHKNTIHTLNTTYHLLDTGYTSPYVRPLSHRRRLS